MSRQSVESGDTATSDHMSATSHKPCHQNESHPLTMSIIVHILLRFRPPMRQGYIQHLALQEIRYLVATIL
jgi:hypothetical protein